jgi:hypothetical protein
LPKPDLPRKTCAQRYGAAPSFVLCEETASSCRFYVNWAAQTCNAICAAGGGVCTSACPEGGSGSCHCSGTQGCGSSAYDAICTCTRP